MHSFFDSITIPLIMAEHIEKLFHWGVDYPNEGNYFEEKPLIPLNSEQKQRIMETSKKLGLETIINTRTGKISSDLVQCKRVIDREMMKKGKQLSNYSIFTQKKHVNEAINFLELFILHIEQTPEISSYYGETTALNKTWDILGRLEALRHEIDISNSGSKASLNVLRQKLDKFVTLLPIVEKKALAKKVRKAEKILKNFLG